MNKIVIAIISVIILCLLGVFVTYNSIQSKSIEVDEKLGQIENQIQRRADLIPNLVKVVKNYAAHESDIFKEISTARNNMMSAKSPKEIIEADNQLSGSLGRLMAIAENYPNLKADTQYTELMRELSGSENRIAVARRDYNEAVKEFNVSILTFPGNMLAPSMGFTKKDMFRAEEKAQSVPEIDL